MNRTLVRWLVMVFVPLLGFASDFDTGAGILYTSGKILVGGIEVPNHSAIFFGDILQALSASGARVQGKGFGFVLLADSRAKCEREFVVLDYGTLALSTYRRTAIKTGRFSVTPTSNFQTEVRVVNDGERVWVEAHKGNVLINDGKDTTSLSAGHELTRFMDGKRKEGASPPMSGTIGEKTLIGTGLAGVVGLGIWVLLQDVSKNPITSPVSSSIP